MRLYLKKILKKNKMANFLGYLFSYVVFTSVLYFILDYLGKIAGGINYFVFYIFTLAIILSGILIKKLIS